MADSSIEVLGCASRIRYRRGSRSIEVDSEPLMGGTLLLYAGSIRKWNDGLTVTAEEKSAIIEDIARLLRPSWGDIDIDPSPYE